MDSGAKGLPLAGLRVLVADHYKPLRWLKAHFLRKRGAEVIEAATGTDALGALETEKVDVAVLHCSLPDMPAAEVRKKMREKAAAVPVVYVAESEDDLPPLDGETFLLQPVNADELAHTILTALGRTSSSASF